MSDLPNIVLVHGAWADGSSWSAVIERLQDSGYHVTAPQFPMTSLAADVARLRQVLARQDGPAIVAGHSYGGQIITALGVGAPNVAGLVYIAAFGLDEGESIGARRRAAVRRPHGRHHRRGAVEPRRDGLSSAGRAGPHPGRRSGRAGLGRPGP
jgi:pimeloyl-ACP methyl ester carboxylesterase